MKVEIVKPSRELMSIVKSYSIIETKLPIETTVLPHLGLVIAIQFKGNISLKNNGQNEIIADLTVSGMRNSFRKFSYEPNSGIILISFTESGASSIFGDAVFELFDVAEPLENVMKPSLVSELQEKIKFAVSNQERLELIKHFLTANRKKEYSPDKLILASLSQIYSTKGLNRIKNIVNHLSISQDVFEKRFRKIVGITPKQFSKIVRMKSIIECQKCTKSFTELAYELGFYDQPHFNKEFKYFTGQNQKTFLVILTNGNSMIFYNFFLYHLLFFTKK